MPSDISADRAQHRPNAADYFVQENLSDGSAITIRAIRPDDKERIVAAFRELEPRSIYTRFFYLKKELSDDELRRLTEIDYVDTVVLVATVKKQTHEIIIGLGRYAMNGRSAEIAITVDGGLSGPPNWRTPAASSCALRARERSNAPGSPRCSPRTRPCSACSVIVACR